MCSTHLAFQSIHMQIKANPLSKDLFIDDFNGNYIQIHMNGHKTRSHKYFDILCNPREKEN